MPQGKRRWLCLSLGLGLALAAGLVWWTFPRERQGNQPVGLFTTLPILWSESADIGTALRPDAPQHWARGELARIGPIVPIDRLSWVAGGGALDRVRLLVMAQPRVLGPQENVALDEWVKGGGRLLLLADPALTEPSEFAIGDPRRPQAVVLLSPILSHWGLQLRIDDAQQFGEAEREVMGVKLPVNLPGHFVTEGQAQCRLWSDGLAVTCRLGKGRVVALADAAVIEQADPDGSRAKAFSWLLDAAFAAE